MPRAFLQPDALRSSHHLSPRLWSWDRGCQCGWELVRNAGHPDLLNGSLHVLAQSLVIWAHGLG